MVTWSPEMLIRWVVPVPAKTFHWSPGMAFWSPTARAVRMPA